MAAFDGHGLLRIKRTCTPSSDSEINLAVGSSWPNFRCNVANEYSDKDQEDAYKQDTTLPVIGG